MSWSIAVAMTADGVIGVGNALPWRLPGDLKRFKEITMGRPVVMGRKTFDSIGRVLPGRRNLVVTRDPASFLGRHASLSLPANTTLEACGDAEALFRSPPSEGENFLIGGGELFQFGLPFVDRLYVTWIDAPIVGDAYFPHWDPKKYRSKLVAKFQDPLPHRFVDYSR